jgi:hypothetical protein
MKVIHTHDIEEVFQELVDSGSPLPTAQELGMTQKQYAALKEKFDLGENEEYGEFWGC